MIRDVAHSFGGRCINIFHCLCLDVAADALWQAAALQLTVPSPAGRGELWHRLVGDSKLCAGIDIDQVNATSHRGCELIDDRQTNTGADRFPRQLGF